MDENFVIIWGIIMKFGNNNDWFWSFEKIRHKRISSDIYIIKSNIQY